MLLVNWWKVVVLQRYTQFVGRAGRAEFWWFFLATFIISAILSILGRASARFGARVAADSRAAAIKSFALVISILRKSYLKL